MKKTISILLAILLSTALYGCKSHAVNDTTVSSSFTAAEVSANDAGEPVTVAMPSPAEAEQVNTTYVLYTNDVHCGIKDNLGYATLSALRAALSVDHDVLLADAGDAVQGDNIGTLSNGSYIIDIMNQIGYDVATLGNHEFGYGMDALNANIERANFPYISANFYGPDGELVCKPYVIFESNGMKIAFVGISTPQTLVSSVPAYFQDAEGNIVYSFCPGGNGQELYDAVQTAVDAARAEGADRVIALGHLGINAESIPWTSSDVITHTNGIDVFIDGHSHSVIAGEFVCNKDGDTVILTSTGTKLQYIGLLGIGTDGSFTTALIDDNGTGAFIKDIENQYAETVNLKVARADTELYITDPGTGLRMVRTCETNLGDLCADAYRNVMGADVGVCNGGSIRADMHAGDITYGDVLSVLPFNNPISMISCTGEQLKDMLEFGCKALPSESGAFLQVSNITYTVDISVPSPVVTDESGMYIRCEGESRVRDVFVGGEPLDLQKTYTLASSDYLLFRNGDGYTMFQDCVTIISASMLENEALLSYIDGTLGGVIDERYAGCYGSDRIQIIG